jgi:3-deoxy-D-manno-octulosonate 8-phosphate phosphatase (KDO 8-P phosphatase)
MARSARIRARTAIPAGLRAKLARVKLLLCDVDGVLTDATVTIGSDSETKRFHIQDGLGMHLLQREGIRVGWISNRPSFATTQRATELKIDFLHQRNGNKVEAVEAILAESRLKWTDVCYVGDDVVDLAVLGRVGVAIGVANGIPEVKMIADYVTKLAGGSGAVREVVELILRAQKKWDRLIERYSA